MWEFYMGNSLHQVGKFFKYVGLRQVFCIMIFVYTTSMVTLQNININMTSLLGQCVILIPETKQLLLAGWKFWCK
jgi:hypothetical protein